MDMKDIHYTIIINNENYFCIYTLVIDCSNLRNQSKNYEGKVITCNALQIHLTNTHTRS